MHPAPCTQKAKYLDTFAQFILYSLPDWAPQLVLLATFIASLSFNRSSAHSSKHKKYSRRLLPCFSSAVFFMGQLLYQTFIELTFPKDDQPRANACQRASKYCCHARISSRPAAKAPPASRAAARASSGSSASSRPAAAAPPEPPSANSRSSVHRCPSAWCSPNPGQYTILLSRESMSCWGIKEGCEVGPAGSKPVCQYSARACCEVLQAPARPSKPCAACLAERLRRHEQPARCGRARGGPPCKVPPGALRRGRDQARHLVGRHVAVPARCPDAKPGGRVLKRRQARFRGRALQRGKAIASAGAL